MRRRILIATLFSVAFTLLLMAWLGSNPPGAGPDEHAHYIKAAALGQGELGGRRATIARNTVPSTLMWRFNQAVTRDFYLPGRLALTDAPPCFAFTNTKPAGCLSGFRPLPAGWYSTHVAIYQPTAYLLPALFIKLAGKALAGILLGRLGIVLITAPLFILAAAVSRDSPMTQFGIVVAATPMVIFLSVMLSDSGTEIAGGVCFAAALLAIARDRDCSSRLVLAAFVFGGVFLAASRATGPLWIAIEAVLFVILTGWGGLNELRRRIGPPALVAALIVIAAVAFDVGWSRVVGGLPTATVHAVINALPQTRAGMLPILVSQIADFGWLDTPAPGVVYNAWELVCVVLILSALVIGNWGQRLALVMLVVAYFALEFGINADLTAVSGFGGQGRYVLPLGVALAMLSGHIIDQRRWVPNAVRAVFLVSGIFLGAMQFLSWWQDSRRYAVGLGASRLFPLHPVSWAPIGGWWPWVALAALGTGALVLACALACLDLLLTSRVAAGTRLAPSGSAAE